MTVPSTPLTAVPSVSRGAACQALGVGERQLRKLVRAGRLQAVGAGHHARILSSSLAAELARRKEIRNSITGIEERSGTLTSAVPNFSRPALDTERSSSHSGAEMLVRLTPYHRDNDMELLSISYAAALVGLSDGVLRRLVEDGTIPSVQIGMRRRISIAALRAWTTGQLQHDRSHPIDLNS